MKVQQLEAQLEEVKSKIGSPREFLTDKPWGQTISDYQKYVDQIASLERVLINNTEVMIENFKRIILQERGKLDAMKQFSGKAERKIEEMKFSPERLQTAIDNDDLWKKDETVQGLLWWLETAKEKIRNQEREISRIEALRTGKQNEANRVKDEIALLKHELSGFENRNRAALEAERAALTGWQDAGANEADDDEADSEAQPTPKRTNGRIIRDLTADIATPAA